MDDDRFARLSEGQRACLRLVHARLLIKQISGELGIAQSTVNARLERARNILGVSSSIDAALALHAYETGQPGWIPPTGSWTPMADSPGLAPSLVAQDGEDEHQDADEADHVGYSRSQSWDGVATRPSGIPWPFSTAGRTDNDIKPFMRLAWVPPVAAVSLVTLVIVVLLTVAAQDILASFEHSLARVL